MHDLQATAANCKAQLKSIGICCPDVPVELDKRASRRWGVCRKYPDGTYRIGISPKLLSAPLGALENTLYHEFLHAATDCTGHTGAWKQLAQYVSRTLGTDITRTATWEDKGLDQNADTSVRYRFVCAGCGAQVVRYRACPFTKRYKRYRCSRCGGSFRKQD